MGMRYNDDLDRWLKWNRVSIHVYDSSLYLRPSMTSLPKTDLYKPRVVSLAFSATVVFHGRCAHSSISLDDQ